MKTEILPFTQDDTLDAACHSERNVVQRRIWVLKSAPGLARPPLTKERIQVGYYQPPLAPPLEGGENDCHAESVEGRHKYAPPYQEPVLSLSKEGDTGEVMTTPPLTLILSP